MSSNAYVIIPNSFKEADLLSSSVPEPYTDAGEVLWNSATSYTVGQEVIRTQTHRRYKCLVAGANTTPPEDSLIKTDASPARWLDIGPTVKFAAYDQVIGTQTIDQSGHLTVEIQSEAPDSIALLEIKGQSYVITMYDGPSPSAKVVKTIAGGLDGTIIESFSDWFFAEYKQKVNVVSASLPPGFWRARIKIEIFGSSGAGVGVIVLGRKFDIGTTQYGAGVGIINYGKVNDDGFGNREWKEGSYARRITLPIEIERSRVSIVDKKLSSIRSTPAIYVGCDYADLEAFVCFGVYKDLYVVVPGPDQATMSLEVEGLNNV